MHFLSCVDIVVLQPSFSPTKSGYSAFVAYHLPVNIENFFVMKFRFSTHDMDQIALMLFVGQEGYHDLTSDHLAVSFIKGHVVLTWNLGSGNQIVKAITN